MIKIFVDADSTTIEHLYRAKRSLFQEQVTLTNTMIIITHTFCSSFMSNRNTDTAVTGSLPTMPDPLDYIDSGLAL